MRRRTWVLLVLLAGVAVTATLVRQRRTASAPGLRPEEQQAVARYATLESNARQQDVTLWKRSHQWTVADAWFARQADAVMNAPADQRWATLLQNVRTWPELSPLLQRLETARSEDWQLERFTSKPSVTVVPPPPLVPADWEFLLSKGNSRAVVTWRTVGRWISPESTGAPPEATENPIEITGHETSHQTGQIVFQPWWNAAIPVPTHTRFIDPLLYRETPLGPELWLVSARQRVTWHSAGNPKNGTWEVGRIPVDLPADPALAAAWADENLDGIVDLWVAGREGLWIAVGDEKGGFQPATLRWRAPEPLSNPQCLAIGDIDRDGRPEVWLTQYKNPYQKGQFPTPYHEANDGFPSFLLHHEGTNGFRDVTAEAGLAGKRHRRTYSASWVDWDGDGHLDLINVSDFSGLDLYQNDGHGKFLDRTSLLGDRRQGFGMAHAVLDQNGDSHPDLLMVGMDSAWAARLDSLGLGRPEFPEHSTHRAAMTWGNRLFLGGPNGFQAAPEGPAAALRRTGWAWGVAELDVENDGRSDYFFTNGHETRGSQLDFERQFWIHDIYVAGSQPDPGTELYFRVVATQRAAEHRSYGGWQHQALLRAIDGGRFSEDSWIAGAGVLADGRNVVAADFDGDGRVDLALTTYEGWPEVRQRLVILRNQSDPSGHWIGLRLPGAAGRKTALNARVELRTPAGHRHRWLMTGDGYRSQQTAQVHFGLGSESRVEALVVYWADGSKTEIPRPAVDQWHVVP